MIKKVLLALILLLSPTYLKADEIPMSLKAATGFSLVGYGAYLIVYRDGKSNGTLNENAIKPDAMRIVIVAGGCLPEMFTWLDGPPNLGRFALSAGCSLSVCLGLDVLFPEFDGKKLSVTARF
jgi:hypothetical protein